MEVINLEEHPLWKRKERQEEAEELLNKANISFYGRRDYAEASKLYRKSINVFSGFDKAPVMAYENLSEAYFMQSKFRETVAVLEQCLEKHPDNPEVMAQLGMLHIDQFEEIVNPLKAVHYFQRIKSINPFFSSGCLTIDVMLMYAEAYADCKGQNRNKDKYE